MTIAGDIQTIINKYLATEGVSKSLYEIAAPENSTEIAGFAYRLQVEDIAGNLLNENPVGMPWQVHVSFRINKNVAHFIIALGIANAIEINIRTTWSKEMEIEPENMKLYLKKIN